MDIDDIGRRWKVRYEVQSSAAPSTEVAPPPDLSVSMLRLRADLLRNEPRLSNKFTHEKELATTLEDLIQARRENDELRGESQWLRDEIYKAHETTNEEKVKSADLQQQLDATKRELEQLRAESEAQKAREADLNTKLKRMESTGSTRSTPAYVTGSSPRSGGAIPAGFPPGSTTTSFRSPMRYSPQRRTTQRSGTPQRTQSPTRTPFKN